MGVRYRNTFYSLAGVTWRIDIGDTSYSSTVNTFQTGQEGFALNYNGISERCDPIMASTVKVPFMVEDSTQEAFINEIMTSQEERFTVQIYKNTALYWSGVLLSDDVTKDDNYYPYLTSLSFTDGTARLRDMEYSNSGVPYSGQDTILTIILRCLAKSGTAALYGATDNYLLTAINYYETRHAFISSRCPMAYTKVNNSIFYEYDSDGNIDYFTCFEVLEMLLRMFNARLMMSDGHYYIFQAQSYSYGYFYCRKFDKGGTLRSSGSALFRITPTTSTRKAGGVFKYFPPLREVTKTYKPKVTNAPDNSFMPIQSDYETEVGFLNTIYIGLEGLVSLLFSGIVHDWYYLSDPGTTPVPIETLYQMKITKTKLYDSSKQYLSGSSQSTTLPTWSSSSSARFNLFTVYKQGYSWHRWSEFSFSTPTIQDECTIDFQMVVSHHYNINGQYYTMGASETFDYECSKFKAVSSYDLSLTQVNEIVYKAQNTLTAGGAVVSSSVVEIPTTDIGDGPQNYSLGKLMTSSDLATWHTGAAWRVNNSTVTARLNQLCVNQVLDGQRKPVEKYQGSFINNSITPAYALVWGSKVFVPTILSIFPATDEVSGEWFNVIT